MQLSVIIVNYNVSSFLAQCLLSVQEALRFIDSEIIVVDNDSKDRSCEMVRTKFPEVKLIANTVNVGFSKANNQGVAIAKGDYVLILNPDTVLSELALQQSLNYIKNCNDFGALGIRLIDGTGTFLPESKRNIPTPKRAFEKLISNSKNTSYYANTVDANVSGEVSVLVGAFMLIKRSVYNEVGGFDEDYFMFGEDIDLSYKILQAGYKNYYYGKAICLHYKGESTPKDLKYLSNFSGAMQLFYKKHFSHNFFYSKLVILGMKLWYWKKRLTLKKQQVASSKPLENTLYIGNDNAFFNLINKKLGETAIFPVCTSRVISKYDDLTHLKNILSKEKTTLIIFDNTDLTFDKILFFMLNIANMTFKIRPKGTNLLIGSNSSTSLGKVIELNL